MTGLGAMYLTALWVALGSALGGAARYWCSGLVARHIGESFPWGTLTVNVAGSLLIGFFATITGPDGRLLVGSAARQFFMLGLLGGFTTFSSFSLQTLALAQAGEWQRAAANVIASVVACLIAVWVGHALALLINRLPDLHAGQFTALWVALGTAIGGAGRFFVSGLVARQIGETFPWGTLTVNVAGSLLIGLVAALTGPDGRLFVGSATRQFFMLGILGGFTTFSSFGLQTLTLAQGGECGRVAANIGATVLLCLGGAWAGHALGTAINR